MKHTTKYSVLGGVIAPSSSTYSIQGMASPLMQRNKRPLDRRLPSMRFRGAVANLDNFNPYSQRRQVSKEVLKTGEAYKRAHSGRRYMTNVQLHGKPAMSPVLSRNAKIR